MRWRERERWSESERERERWSERERERWSEGDTEVEVRLRGKRG